MEVVVLGTITAAFAGTGFAFTAAGHFVFHHHHHPGVVHLEVEVEVEIGFSLLFVRGVVHHLEVDLSLLFIRAVLTDCYVLALGVVETERLVGFDFHHCYVALEEDKFYFEAEAVGCVAFCFAAVVV